MIIRQSAGQLGNFYIADISIVQTSKHFCEEMSLTNIEAEAYKGEFIYAWLCVQVRQNQIKMWKS